MTSASGSRRHQDGRLFLVMSQAGIESILGPSEDCSGPEGENLADLTPRSMNPDYLVSWLAMKSKLLPLPSLLFPKQELFTEQSTWVPDESGTSGSPESCHFPKPGACRFIVTLGSHAKGGIVWSGPASSFRTSSAGDLWSGSLNHTSVNSLFSTVIKTPSGARVSHCSFTSLARQCGGGCQPHNSHRTETNGRWGRQVARRQEVACQRNTCLEQAMLPMLRSILCPWTYIKNLLEPWERTGEMSYHRREQETWAEPIKGQFSTSSEFSLLINKSTRVSLKIDTRFLPFLIDYGGWEETDSQQGPLRSE